VYEEVEDLDEQSKKRRDINPQAKPPRSTRAARFKRKKSPMNGVHHRRNKHWSW
jgi:hypothetical protein